MPKHAWRTCLIIALLLILAGCLPPNEDPLDPASGLQQGTPYVPPPTTPAAPYPGVFTPTTRAYPEPATATPPGTTPGAVRSPTPGALVPTATGPVVIPTITPAASPSPTPTPTVYSGPTFTPTPTLLFPAGTPLPATLEPITALNAGEVSGLAVFSIQDLTDLEWAPDGQTLAVANPGAIYLFAARTRRQVAMLPAGPGLVDIDFSPDGIWLASGGYTGSEKSGYRAQVRLWSGPGLPATLTPIPTATSAFTSTPIATRSPTPVLPRTSTPTPGAPGAGILTSSPTATIGTPGPTVTSTPTGQVTLTSTPSATPTATPTTGSLSGALQGLAGRLAAFFDRSSRSAPAQPGTLTPGTPGTSGTPGNTGTPSPTAAGALASGTPSRTLPAGPQVTGTPRTRTPAAAGTAPPSVSPTPSTTPFTVTPLVEWDPRGILFLKPRPLSRLSFSPGGETLVSAWSNPEILQDNRVEFRSTLTWQITRTLTTTTVLNLEFSPDGDLLATVPHRYAIQVWDLSRNVPNQVFFTSFTGAVNSLAFSPDNIHLATGHYDGTISIWNLDSGEAESVFQTDGVVESLAYHPDGSLLAVGLSYPRYRPGQPVHLVQLWSLAQGVGLVRSLEGHSLGVVRLEFSPRGDLLASASYDGSIWLWGLGP